MLLTNDLLNMNHYFCFSPQLSHSRKEIEKCKIGKEMENDRRGPFSPDAQASRATYWGYLRALVTLVCTSPSPLTNVYADRKEAGGMGSHLCTVKEAEAQTEVRRLSEVTGNLGAA